MSRDTSGRYTLGFIIFGFIFSLLLIFGTGLFSIAKKLNAEPAAPPAPTFPLSAADFTAFHEASADAAVVLPPRLERAGGAPRLERPLRLGAPVRGSLVPAALMQAEDARQAAGAVQAAPGVEWVPIDSRLERYDALARGDVELLWDTLGSLAEELPRLSALGLEARVVLMLGGSDPADRLMSRTEALPRNPRHWAVVEAFGPTHLIALEQLTLPKLSAAEKGQRFVGLAPVGSPAEARSLFDRGDAWAVGLPADAAAQGQPDVAQAPFLNVEVLVAHPRLIAEAPEALAALLARWTEMAATPRTEAVLGEAAGVFKLEGKAIQALASLTGLPDADAQQRFFAGAGAKWMEASAELWMKLGLMRKPEPAARWFDGRFVPQEEAQSSR